MRPRTAAKGRLISAEARDKIGRLETKPMTTKVRALAETVVRLPPKDRTYLAEQLLASLDEESLDQQWRAEAKRRLHQIRSGRVKPIPAEEVYLRIDRLLGK